MYNSRYSSGFVGCLGCGSTDHRFRQCPRNNERDIRDIFWQELWVQVPSTRKKDKPSPPFATVNPLSPQLKSLLPLLFHLLLIQIRTPILLLSNNETTLNALVFSRYLLAFPIFPLLSVNLCISSLITLFHQLVFN